MSIHKCNTVLTSPLFYSKLTSDSSKSFLDNFGMNLAKIIKTRLVLGADCYNYIVFH